MTQPFHLIALCGLAGAGKDSVADVLVRHAGFARLAFADALRSEVAAAFSLRPHAAAMAARPVVLSDRALKELPQKTLALVYCDEYAFIDAVAPVLGGYSVQLMHAERTPRQILQLWGTEYRRAQDPRYWIDKALLALGGIQRAGIERIVITDCRFENEAALVRRQGGTLWQVTRPGLDAVEGHHASQTDGAQFGPEATVRNDGTLVELAHRVLATMVTQHGGIVLPAAPLRDEVLP